MANYFIFIGVLTHLLVAFGLIGYGFVNLAFASIAKAMDIDTNSRKAAMAFAAGIAIIVGLTVWLVFS